MKSRQLAPKKTLTVGVISDTHGTILQNVHKAFSGVDHILHAGDIGGPAVLMELELIAPVTAVTGNMDHWEHFPDLHEQTAVTLGTLTAVIIHDHHRLRNPPPDVQLLICGHTHKKLWDKLSGYAPGLHEGHILNPGSASRRSAHPSVAILTIKGNSVQHRFEML